MDNADKGPQDVGNDYPSMRASADSERAANEVEFERVFNQVVDKPMADASDYSNKGRNSVAPEPDSNYSHEGRNSAVQADYSNEGRNATAPSAPAAAPMTFGQKFAAERKAGNKTFKWGDKIITTQLLSEVPAKGKPKATPAQAAPVKSVMLQDAPVATQQTAQAAPEPFDPYRGRVEIAGEAAPTARAVVKAAPTPVKAVAVVKNPALDIANPVSRPLPQDNFPISPAILDRRTPTALEASNRRIEKVGTTTLSDAINTNRYGAQKS